MIDFAAARRAMVQGQVRINDVTDPRLTSAMLELPRERFVPQAMAGLAYLDRDLVITEPGAEPRRFLLKPLTLAKLIQAAEVKPEDRVLDVGCAGGYAAALLAKLTRSVMALEEARDVAHVAEQNLSAVAVTSVEVVIGPLAAGWAAGAPYDVVLLEGRSEVEPVSLLEQLATGGRLVCVQGRDAAAKGMIYRRVAGEVSAWPLFEAPGAPLLPGFAAPAEFVF